MNITAKPTELIRKKSEIMKNRNTIRTQNRRDATK